MMVTEKRLIDAHKIRYVWMVDDDGEWHDGVTLQSIIDKMPTVDAVEVVHGEWVGVQYDGYADGCPVYDLWECSECREEYESEGDPPPYKYCPNCGAKMDGGYDDDR